MSKNGGRQCKETTDEGRPCRAPIVLESGYCPAHDPDRHEEFLAQTRRGGEVTRKMFAASLGELPPLDSPAAAKEWLERLGRAIANNRLSGSAGNACIRAVREWRQAHETEVLEKKVRKLADQVKQLKERGVV